MAPKLRLRRDKMEAAEPPVLRFPVEAVASFPVRGTREPGVDRWAGVRRLTAATIPFTSADDVVRGVEETLDQMQEKLDELKGQVQENYRLLFPGIPGGDRPWAA